jgi:type IV pilus assembly protein PilN
MIRINLLPFRAARKKENIKRQVSVFILAVILLFSVMGFIFITLTGKLAGVRNEKAQKTKELAHYEATNKKLEDLRKKIEEIRTKLGVIRTLEKNKTGPVRLLDEIATAVPKDKLWLRSLEEKRGLLTLTGTAMDNETVALFMTNLEKAGLITSVDLKNTKLRTLQQYKLNVTDFVLECKTYIFEKKVEAPAPVKGAKKPAVKPPAKKS